MMYKYIYIYNMYTYIHEREKTWLYSCTPSVAACAAFIGEREGGGHYHSHWSNRARSICSQTLTISPPAANREIDTHGHGQGHRHRNTDSQTHRHRFATIQHLFPISHFLVFFSFFSFLSLSLMHIHDPSTSFQIQFRLCIYIHTYN